MSYLPIPGSPAYAAAVQKLMFGEGHEVETSGRAATSHTPGGTGALRVAADFIHQANAQGHRVAHAAHVAEPSADLRRRRRADEELPVLRCRRRTAWRSTKSLAAIKKIPAGDVIMLHGCCHNPTGIDPTPEQWKKLADVIYERGAAAAPGLRLPGLCRRDRRRCGRLASLLSTRCRADRLQLVLQELRPVLRARRCAYGRRQRQSGADTVQSQVKVCIRSNYSNPPAHGAELVTTVLSDPELRKLWEKEVAEMRDRINGMRELLVKTLKSQGRAGRLFVHHPPTRHVLVLRPDARRRSKRSKQKYAIYIVRLRPDQRGGHHRAECRAAVRSDCRRRKIARNNGDKSNLCEAPFGPFRQIGLIPFFTSPVANETRYARSYYL